MRHTGGEDEIIKVMQEVSREEMCLMCERGGGLLVLVAEQKEQNEQDEVSSTYTLEQEGTMRFCKKITNWGRLRF